MIREQAASLQSPLKLICDNMINVWDNVPNNPGLIWDDDNEVVIWLYPNSGNTESGQVSEHYPFRKMYIPYEMIQYIDILMDPKDAYAFIQEHKAEKNVMAKRAYTGTISEYPHREIHPRIGE